jgi:RNA recognition motif-containing protein
VDQYANKIFIKNLPFTATTEELQSHINTLLDTMKAAKDNQSMDVSENIQESKLLPGFTVELILSKAGKSRGMAIIDCAQSDPSVEVSSDKASKTIQLSPEAPAINESPSEVVDNPSTVVFPSNVLITALNGSVFNGRTPIACALNKQVLEENSVVLIPQSVKTPTEGAEMVHSAPGSVGTTIVAQSISAHHPTTVFVSKLAKEWTAEDLRAIFADCGNIIEVKVPVDKQSGQVKVSIYISIIYK